MHPSSLLRSQWRASASVLTCTCRLLSPCPAKSRELVGAAPPNPEIKFVKEMTKMRFETEVFGIVTMLLILLITTKKVLLWWSWVNLPESARNRLLSLFQLALLSPIALLFALRSYLPVFICLSPPLPPSSDVLPLSYFSITMVYAVLGAGSEWKGWCENSEGKLPLQCEKTSSFWRGSNSKWWVRNPGGQGKGNNGMATDMFQHAPLAPASSLYPPCWTICDILSSSWR